MFLFNFVLIVASYIVLAQNCVCNEVPEKIYYDLNLSENLFQNYITEYNKVYTDEEAEYRFKVFQDSLKNINDLNKQHESTVFRLNRFSDLTFEEFQSLVACSHASDAKPIEVNINKNLPDKLDYRTQNMVTEVKDQGSCGSCYIFGAIGEIEGQYAKKHKEVLLLSEQYPLDCHRNFTCRGGLPVNVMKWLSSTPGAITRHDYPYKGYKTNCTADPKQGVAKVVNSTSFAVTTSDGIKTVLFEHGPLSISIYASPQFLSYSSGVLKPTDCPKHKESNHAVLLVGYGKDGNDDYWLIKNSWGIVWGEQGYVRLAFNKCNVGTEISASEVM